MLVSLLSFVLATVCSSKNGSLQSVAAAGLVGSMPPGIAAEGCDPQQLAVSHVCAWSQLVKLPGGSSGQVGCRLEIPSPKKDIT